MLYFWDYAKVHKFKDYLLIAGQLNKIIKLKLRQVTLGDDNKYKDGYLSVRRKCEYFNPLYASAYLLGYGVKDR